MIEFGGPVRSDAATRFPVGGRGWLALIVLSLLLPMGGCGGCGCSRRDRASQSWGGMSREEWLKQKAERDAAEKKEEEESRRREAEAEAARRAEQQRKLEEARAKAEEQRAQRQSRDLERTATLPPPPPLDDDVELWGEHDFWLARSAADRRLIDALARRAAKPRGDAAEAELFASLLAPSGDGPRAGRATGADRDFVAIVMRATAVALAANATPEARQVLRAMVEQRAGAEDPVSAADGALEALMRLRAEWADALVMEALAGGVADPVAAGAAVVDFAAPMLPDDDGPRTGPSSAAALSTTQQRILARIQRSGGPDLRARLARHLAVESANAAWRARVRPILMEDRPDNLEAQAILYRQPWLELSDRRALEAIFTRSSAAVLEGLLDVAPPGTRFDADHAGRVVACLWNDEFARLVQLREHSGSRLADSASLLQFASTVPRSAMRMEARRAVSRHWQEGCGALSALEATRPGLCDPGFLISLKTAWRDERPRTGGRTDGRRRPSGAAGLGNAEEAGPSANRRAPNAAGGGSTEWGESWLRWNESLLRAWCKRCHEVGLRDAEGAVGATLGANAGGEANGTARDGASGRAGGVAGSSDNGLPGMAPGGTVLSRFERSLAAPPGDGRLAVPLPPLCVRFVRYELRSTVAQVAEHYRRALRGAEEHRMADGAWIDAMQRASADQYATVRSVDVLVRRRLAGRSGQGDAAEPLVVDVLLIETIEESEDAVARSASEPTGAEATSP